MKEHHYGVSSSRLQVSGLETRSPCSPSLPCLLSESLPLLASFRVCRIFPIHTLEFYIDLHSSGSSLLTYICSSKTALRGPKTPLPRKTKSRNCVWGNVKHKVSVIAIHTVALCWNRMDLVSHELAERDDRSPLERPGRPLSDSAIVRDPRATILRVLEH